MPASSFRSIRILWYGAALTLTTAGPAAAVDSGATAIAPTTEASNQAPDLRVATIAFRIAARNVARCPRTEPLTGLLLHDISAYDPADRAAIRAAYGLGDGFGVLGVVPGSPAAQAGLQPGDEIVALDGSDPVRLGLPAPSRTASYDRVAAFLDRMRDRLSQGAASLTVRRGTVTRALALPLERGCEGQVAVVPGNKPEAWSDARYIALTHGLAAQAGDDELAFAIAHEMAHVVLGHAGEPHSPLAGIGIGGPRSRERERVADHLGILMVLGAGYDPAGAEALLARLVEASGPDISLTHPSVRSRIAAIRQTVAEERGAASVTGNPR